MIIRLRFWETKRFSIPDAHRIRAYRNSGNYKIGQQAVDFLKNPLQEVVERTAREPELQKKNELRNEELK